MDSNVPIFQMGKVRLTEGEVFVQAESAREFVL